MPSSSSASSDSDSIPVTNDQRSSSLDNDQEPTGRHRSSVVTPTTPHKTSSTCEHRVGGSRAPLLGDFGQLWDILNDRNPEPPGYTRSTTINSPNTAVQQQTSMQPPAITLPRRPSPDTTAQQPSTPSKPITILQRPSKDSQTDSSAQQTSVSRACLSISQETTVRSTNIVSAETSATSDSNLEAELNRKLISDPSSSQKRGTFPFVPPQVGVPSPRDYQPETPPSSYDDLAGSSIPPAVVTAALPGSWPVPVHPLYKSTTDRRVGLLTKLLRRFPDYVDLIAQVGRPVASNNNRVTSRPIHVFVDMSNIMIGFNDCVKLARDIPIERRLPRQPFSFRNFSLVLERGRPAAKRVLVGSEHSAAVKESEQLGYETNILDRVQRVKTLSRQRPKRRRHQDFSSSSETNDASGEREQAVDEILQLKIMESIVDCEQPATIVLATGDAAEAEFSEGFMRTVERALLKKWTVELVSFSHVTSSAYRKKQFREKWGWRFKLILLDDYIEELLNS
ncbi:hypothetical protein BDV59DRAFT_202374 [Aspergillus ambiguus]|uniref:uncharacterized protein n=1 Tax=Aspergillus ambiguus TaxID=176160 RepID=UPI003CCE310F